MDGVVIDLYKVVEEVKKLKSLGVEVFIIGNYM